MLAYAAAAPPPALSHDVAPVSAVRAALAPPAVEEPGLLVSMALVSGVELDRVVDAVAAAVLAAARVGGVQPWYRADGSQCPAGTAGAWTCPAHADTYEDLEAGCELRGTDYATRAAAELCCAVRSIGVERPLDVETELSEAVAHAGDAIGEQAVVDAFTSVIPWSEIASAAAEVEL